MRRASRAALFRTLRLSACAEQWHCASLRLEHQLGLSSIRGSIIQFLRITPHAPLCRYTYVSVCPSADQATAENIPSEAGTEKAQSALPGRAPHEAPVADDGTEINYVIHGLTDMRLEEGAAIEEAEEDAAKKQAVQPKTTSDGVALEVKTTELSAERNDGDYAKHLHGEVRLACACLRWGSSRVEHLSERGSLCIRMRKDRLVRQRWAAGGSKRDRVSERPCHSRACSLVGFDTGGAGIHHGTHGRDRKNRGPG